MAIYWLNDNVTITPALRPDQIGYILGEVDGFTHEVLGKPDDVQMIDGKVTVVPGEQFDSFTVDYDQDYPTVDLAKKLDALVDEVNAVPGKHLIGERLIYVDEGMIVGIYYDPERRRVIEETPAFTWSDGVTDGVISA